MMRAGKLGGGIRKSRGRLKTPLLVNLALLALAAMMWAGGWLGAAEPSTPADTTDVNAPVITAPSAAKAPAAEGALRLFGPLLDREKYPFIEQAALIVVLLIAIAGLVYAGMLVKQVKAADQGTARMQEIARAVREGANAYLGAQFRRIGPLIILITIGLFFTKYSSLRPQDTPFAYGRAGAVSVGLAV